MTITSCPPPSAGRTAMLIGAGALAGLFLAACGGDDHGPAPAPTPPAAITQVPTSAAANDAALEAFAFNLPRTEDTEPLTLDLVPMLPSSETEDPIATP